MADQGHVLNILEAHDATNCPGLLQAPEKDSGRNLLSQLILSHVRLFPPVLRDGFLVDGCCQVYYCEHGGEVRLFAQANHMLFFYVVFIFHN